jgi:hypothetical protein
MSDTYILDNDHNPVPCDMMTWARMFEESDRHVAETMQGEVRVSTVFLGLDHGFGEGPPVLFETMVLVDEQAQGRERYCTWAEAEAGHKRWVMEVFKATPILALPTTGDE